MTRPAILVARQVFRADPRARCRAHFEVEANPADQIFTPAELTAPPARQGRRLHHRQRAHRRRAAGRPARSCGRCATWRWATTTSTSPACTARGVLATNTPDVLTETTADFGFALMMATARRIAESEHFLRRGEWTQWAYDMFTGSDVHGATLGILGMGRIGQAHRAARRAGLRHEGDLSQPQPAGGRGRGAARARAGSTRPRCCARPTTWCWWCRTRPPAHHAIGAAELAQMKPTATLTNIARGGIVDDAALAAGAARAAHRRRRAWMCSKASRRCTRRC